ncbi:MAG: fused MFS/spermidine synthase, partial [bacterium]
MGQRIRLHMLFIAMGFAAMAAQIVIMRRMIVCFGGNELVTGGVLAGWLGFSGLGNLLSGGFADRTADARRACAISLIAMALLIPGTLVGTYFIKAVLGLPAPAMVGLGTAILSAIVMLAPLGLVVGTSFTIACKLPATGQSSDIGRVYLFDALGAGLGGLLVSLIALRYMTAMQSALAAAMILIAIVAAAIPQRAIKVASLCMLALLGVATWRAERIDSWLTAAQWQGYNPAVHRESLFATLMVTDNRGERTLFIDNRPSFSLPLPETYESIAHIPLLEHADPRDVLMIEGGISGVIDQWRRLGLSSASFARLDPAATALERDDMPSNLADIPPWAQIHHVDGRRLIREGIAGRCKQGCYDAIIVNVGEPDTAAADRYYTAEFFKEAADSLKPGGILCLALMEPSNAVSSERAALLGGIQATLDSVFPHTLLLPLDRYYFFASRNAGALTQDLSRLSARLDRRGIDAPFLSTQVLPGIYPERIESTQRIVQDAAKRSEIDTDLRPRAYF